MALTANFQSIAVLDNPHSQGNLNPNKGQREENHAIANLSNLRQTGAIGFRVWGPQMKTLLSQAAHVHV